MQEAEVALLPIGAVLEWTTNKHDAVLQGWAADGVYEVWPGSAEPGYEAFKTAFQTVEGPGYNYATIAEAKAACEIHAATGRFPPSVKP